MRALEYLMGTYFHQDWDLDGGAVSDTVSAFVQGAPTKVAPTIADIDDLLAEGPAERSLRMVLESMGCEYYAGDSDEAYRVWLVEIRDQLSATSAREA